MTSKLVIQNLKFDVGRSTFPILLIALLCFIPGCQTSTNTPIPPGSPTPISATDPGLQKAVAHSLSNKRLASPVSKITNATTQTVAGTKYRFRLQLENTSAFNVTVLQDLQGKFHTLDFSPVTPQSYKPD